MSRTAPAAPEVSQSAPAARPRVHLIAALAANRVIGAQGRLPWNLPEDLKRFRAVTLGHPVIMGRRTWESLPRALPGRDNIVVTRQPGYAAAGARVAASLESALALCAHSPLAFVIGGEALYRTALPYAERLQLTEIHRDYDGDVRFPVIGRDAWQELSRERVSSETGLRFDFVLYERRRPGAAPA